MTIVTVLSFSAGYATYDESTKTVTPRPGPGKITITKNPEEPYYSFKWEPRDGFEPTDHVSATDIDLLIPGDAKWIHCKNCTTGRVFVLKFNSSDRKEFFWMQSRTDAKDRNVASLSTEDQRIAATFEKILADDEEEEEEDEDLMEQDEPASSSQPAKSTDNSDPNALTTENPQLASLIKSMSNRLRQSQKLASSSSSSFPILSLSDAFSSSDFIDYVNGISSEKELEPLLSLLPENVEKSKEELIRVIRSSQFAQGVESLSHALRQGGLGHVIANELEFPYQGEGIEGYLTGLYQGDKSKKKEKDDEEMED